MVVRLTTARAGRKEKRSKCRKKKRVRREGRRAERCPGSGGRTAGEPGRGPGASIPMGPASPWETMWSLHRASAVPLLHPQPGTLSGSLFKHKSPSDPTVVVPSPGAASDVCVAGPCLRRPRRTFTVFFEGVSEALS